MAKHKKRKHLREAINKEQVRNEMIRETRKATFHGLIVLFPIIAIFGATIYDFTQ